MSIKDYTMRVWVKDLRYKEGWRLENTYEYPEKEENWMVEEKRFLEETVLPRDRYKIEIFASWYKSETEKYKSTTT